jgi:hypothetical protein
MNGKLRFHTVPRHLLCWKSWLGLILLAVPPLLHADWGVNFQTTYIKSSLNQGTYPYALVTGDFNGDGQAYLTWIPSRILPSPFPIKIKLPFA